jgi:hypothetical protein
MDLIQAPKPGAPLHRLPASAGIFFRLCVSYFTRALAIEGLSVQPSIDPSPDGPALRHEPLSLDAIVALCFFSGWDGYGPSLRLVRLFGPC